MDRKKIFILAVVIIVLILSATGAYLYFTKKPVAVGGPQGEIFPGEGKLIDKTPKNNEVAETDPLSSIPADGTFPRLHELHKTPVAGVGFLEQSTAKEKKVFVRSIERGLGHIFETDLNTLSESRISLETYPGLVEAFFGNNGSSVVVRSLSEQEQIAIETRALDLTVSPTATTKLLPLGEATTPTSLVQPKETHFPAHIPHLAISEDGANKVFYLQTNDDLAEGSITTFKKTGISTIFKSSFTEWLPQLPNQKLATLTTKPSGNVPGHLFFLDTQNGVLTKILSNINGLTTSTNRDGKFVLYSESKAGALNLFSYDVTKKTSRPLPLKTLPEKCAWGNKDTAIAYCATPQVLQNGLYPDQWYQGTISFSDSVWKVDVKTGTVEKVFAPADFGGSAMDIINPLVSKDNTYLLFINKISSTPWLFLIDDAPRTIAPAPKTGASNPTSFNELEKIR